MGLIARQLEESGIPTVTMTCARDITEAVNPPRSVFLDFPLGHTTGRAHDPVLGRRIIEGALAAFADADHPGWMSDQSIHWADDDSWKDSVMRPVASGTTDIPGSDDERSPRRDTPQYQSIDDASAAEKTHGDEQCLVCKGVDY